MKALAIAFKDLRSAFRSSSAFVFMFGIPLMVTGMFYLMFGKIAEDDGFEIARIPIAIANLDQGGPRLQMGRSDLPQGIHADTMGELVAEVLAGEDLSDLLAVTPLGDAGAARAAVDAGQVDVAVIIPPDFSHRFADPDAQASLELYVDPTKSLGPAVVRAVLSRFIDGMAGVKIVVDQALDAAENGAPPESVGPVIAAYVDSARSLSGDSADEFLAVQPPPGKTETTAPILALITPIMGGMMIFYSFFTGVSTAQSILVEDEARTLPRLFTTPTARQSVLAGKFLAVFLTVAFQVCTLILASRLIFGIRWGAPLPVAAVALGLVAVASTCGIFINSMLKTTHQGGMIFGGLLTITGMVGMIRIFAMNSPQASQMGESVSLLVPQGWVVRGVLEASGGAGLDQMGLTLAVLAAWSVVFFVAGAARFRRRYG